MPQKGHKADADNVLMTSDKWPSIRIICRVPRSPPVAVADISLPISGRLMRTRYPAQFFRGRERRRRKREANGERGKTGGGGTQQLILTALLKGERDDDMG